MIGEMSIRRPTPTVWVLTHVLWSVSSLSCWPRGRLLFQQVRRHWDEVVGPQVPFEADLQVFLHIATQRETQGRENGQRAQKVEGKLRPKDMQGPLIVDSRPCYSTVQTHQAPLRTLLVTH